jgi:hypothetical protein
MNRATVLLVGLGVSLASFAIACSSTTSDDGASHASEINGGLSNAKTCAVQEAYAAAELRAFQHLAKTQLPSGVTADAPTAIAKFTVKDVGTVFVVEEASTISFYDSNGALVAKALVSGSFTTWQQPTGLAASCLAFGGGSDGGSGHDAGTSSGGFGDDDDDTTDSDGGSASLTCLDTNPIDATQYPYKSARPAQPGACSAQELTNFSAYYRAHASEDALMIGWRASVSPTCEACIFSDDTAAAWGPMVISGDGSFQVNRGGCIEKVSGNQACGKSYEQFQNCLLDACLSKCTTQSEFTACRQDATVLQTACKAALDNVQASCGENNIGGYETECKGTTYTFEGPIRAACVAH